MSNDYYNTNTYLQMMWGESICLTQVIAHVYITSGIHYEILLFVLIQSQIICIQKTVQELYLDNLPQISSMKQTFSIVLYIFQILSKLNFLFEHCNNSTVGNSSSYFITFLGSWIGHGIGKKFGSMPP